MPYYSEGPKVNPVAGALLAQSPAQPNPDPATFDIVTKITGTIGMAFRFEHRNAANDTTLYSMIVGTPAFDTKPLAWPSFVLDTGERVRLVSVGTIVGQCQAEVMISF